MINSNKAMPNARELSRWFDRPREVSLRRLAAGLRYRPDRSRALRRPSARRSRRCRGLTDFDLYGEGWERRHPAVDPALHAAAQRVYRGPIDDKLALLAGYRFALVYENTRFRGYISEKLFDCFFARCIPIYSGAPDVAQFVPPNAFIDARQFATYPELERFLRGITEEDAKRYVDAAHAFLVGPAYESFCAERFARDLVDALLHVSGK